MENNDLGNTSSPTVYVVWEGLVATCGDMGRMRRAARLRRYQKALDMFETNPVAVDAMWQSMRHGTFNISIVTHLPTGMAELLRDRLDYDLVPFQELLAMSVGDFVNRLPHMPWLYAVADPDAYRSRAYGSFGRYVPVEHAERIGNLL